MNSQAEKHNPQPSEEELALGTEPIPAAPYYSREYFELEREAIFKRSWLQIGHLSEIPEPGCYMVRTVDIARASILVTHTRDGKVRAFHNVCPHRGTQLVSDSGGRASSFTCPYHAWTFNDDGQLRAAPDFDRFYVDKADCGLKEVAADVCAQLIFINLDPDPEQGLHEYLAPLGEQLEQLTVARATHFSEYVYEIDANWKLAYDNFQENYHLRFIHPRSGAGGTGPDNPFGYPVGFGFHGPHRTQTIWHNANFSPTPTQALGMGKCVEKAMKTGFMNSDKTKQYYALFPNFFMLGSPVQPFSHMIMPIAPNKSRGTIRIYWIDEDENASLRFGREYAMATALDIHSEDRGVIEAGQRGLDSGALDVIHFQSQEVLCRHLFQSVDQRVRAYQQQAS